MMQNGQPVAYASRILTTAEVRYAQIEELLAIVLACNHFDAYIYGRERVNVETDHQPLEMIVHKPLNCAPKRLQGMLLQLQKYILMVHYKVPLPRSAMREIAEDTSPFRKRAAERRISFDVVVPRCYLSPSIEILFKILCAQLVRLHSYS